MAYAEYPVMEYFTKEGWALPVQSNSRYSVNQKKILYNLFMQGEDSNKKVTPDQAVQEIRKTLPVESCDVKAN